MKKKIILILSCLLVLLIGAGAVLGILMLTDETDSDKYRRKLQAANKYVQEERWEDAIVAYLEAIEYNNEDEAAYYTLAEIYIYQDRMDEAKELLETGIRLTNSDKLRALYEEYFQTAEAEGELKQKAAELAVNTALLNQIAAYSFEDYSNKYGTASCTMKDGRCLVRHRNLSGVEFVYYNTDDYRNIVDEAEGKPKENGMPWEAVFDDISTIISGSEGSISYEDLQGLNLKNLRMDYDGTMDSNVVSFEISKCQITLACDGKGNVSTDAWNKAVPKYGNTESDAGVMEVVGSIIDAATGQGVAGAVLYIRERGATAGEVLLEVRTENDGSYVMNIGEGKYTAEVECEDFITEYIDFEVNQWGETDMEQFVISPQLEEGQIRIVLEWGEYPRDLDSHLTGTDSAGNRIHVYFARREYDAANLDVDETDSFGPETVTILDIYGDYEYSVYDFTESGNISMSGATVKVYIPGQSAPVVYEVPPALENEWKVCRISNGTVSDY